MNAHDDEANAFALALLIPAHLLRQDIHALGGIDIVDDQKINQLAKRYCVSVTTMTLSIGQLSVIPFPD